MTTNFAWEMPEEVGKDASKGQSWSPRSGEKQDAGGWFASLLKGGKEEQPMAVGGVGKAAKPTLMDLLTGKKTNRGRRRAPGAHRLAAGGEAGTDLSDS